MAPFPRVLSFRIRECEWPGRHFSTRKTGASMHTQAGENFRTGNEWRASVEYRRVYTPRSREFLLVDPPLRCLAASAEPHFLRDLADGSQPRPISIKRESKESEETRRADGRRRARKRRGFGIVLKYVCF